MLLHCDEAGIFGGIRDHMVRALTTFSMTLFKRMQASCPWLPDELWEDIGSRLDRTTLWGLGFDVSMPGPVPKAAGCCPGFRKQLSCTLATGRTRSGVTKRVTRGDFYISYIWGPHDYPNPFVAGFHVQYSRKCASGHDLLLAVSEFDRLEISYSLGPTAVVWTEYMPGMHGIHVRTSISNWRERVVAEQAEGDDHRLHDDPGGEGA